LRLRHGVRRVVEALRREGYLEADAEGPRFRTEAQGAVLELPLKAGERVALILDGIDEWAGRPLRAIARSRFGETIDEKWARRVAGLMEEHLRTDGYLDVAVTPEFGHAFGRRTLTFHVNRGPRVHVARVRFEGNETVPSRRLRRYMSLVVGGILRSPPFTQKALDRDLKTLGDYYISRGYLDARVAVLDLDVPPSGKAQLLIRVDEGAQYRWRDVLFVSDGVLSVEGAQAAAAIQSGSIASPNAQEEARLRLLKELERRGYPGAIVTYRETKDTAEAVVDLAYRVVGGPLVRFGKTVISGNARTKTRVIRRGLKFREGDPWDQQKVLQSRQLLYRLGVFQQVRIEALATTTEKGVRDVRVAVVDQDAGSVTFGLGYGTEEKLKGFGAISHANLQGAGRTFELRAEFDDFDSSYAANFREPWLFGRKFDLRLTLVRSFQNREAYDLASWAFQSALERIFTERIRGSIVYTLESNRLSDVVDEQVEELNDPDLEEYLLSAVGPVLAWDSRNDPFNPKRGFYHTFQAEFALEPLGSEVAYQRFVGSASGFFTAGKYTLALQGRAGLAVRLGQTVELPANKRFYLGGRTSVRGYKKDEVGPQVDGTPIGGDTMVNLRAEVRFPIWKQFGGALFWDAGNVWNRFLGASDYLELRHGVGGGLRYVTPVGPLSVDLGFKLRQRSGEEPYQWHFTAGSVF
jgi:outer membrane protein insertion porin family